MNNCWAMPARCSPGHRAATGSSACRNLPQDALRACGFDDREAAMPVVAQAFQGYRLLQEYFALPQRYLFVDVAGLSRAVKRCSGQELELIVLFERFDPSLEGSVSAAQFVPFCTPAINLFPRRLDRIHLSERVNEHHVIADRTRPMDFSAARPSSAWSTANRRPTATTCANWASARCVPTATCRCS